MALEVTNWQGRDAHVMLSSEVRTNLAECVEDAKHRQIPTIVLNYHTPVAALISIEEYERLQDLDFRMKGLEK